MKAIDIVRCRIGFGFGLAAVLVWSGASGQAQSLTQTFTLVPGWNSIWLEVEPERNDAAAVFAGLPMESAWTFQARLSAVQFVEDANEAVWNRSSWRMYLPTNRVDSFQNNLFAVHANRPYLLHLTNTSPVSWSVSGVPKARALEWVPDSFNLRGFPVDPAAPPTFANFFRPARAHFDPATGLRKIYRLNSSGQWSLVSGGDTLQRNVAYWVFAQGNSTFTAPLELTLGQGDALDYGTSLRELPLELSNLGGAGATISVRDLCPPSVLSYWRFSTDNAASWPVLPVPHLFPLTNGGGHTLRLAVRRQDFTNHQHACVLEISDGRGTLHRVGVTARKPASQFAGLPSTPTQQAQSHAGLWMGTVTLNAVSEVNSGNLLTNAANGSVSRVGVSTNPTPTRSEVNLRLLLHVDTNGATRILREVVQMWADGSRTNDPSGLARQSTPGRFVLLTDESLIPNYRGATLREGQPVGRRLSTVGFDFDAGGDATLPLAGSFGVPHRLTGALTLAPTSPTNPFRHKYHPDHDNLDATFRNFAPEAYAVTRHIELQFTAADPTGSSAPDYGYGVLAGTYRERVSGLHKDELHVAGIFRLSRVTVTGVLNQ